MQIHEVTLRQKTDEGILDTATKAYNQVKGGIAGAKAGYQDAQASRGTKEVGTKATDVWNKYVRQLEASLTTPEEKQQFRSRTPDTEAGKLYEKALRAFVQKNLLKGQKISSLVNGAQIENLIKGMVSSNSPTAQQWQQLSMASAVSRPADDAGQTTSPDNMALISPDPAAIKFDRRLYVLNDQGEWSDSKNGKIPDQSMQAMFDKKLRFG